MIELGAPCSWVCKALHARQQEYPPSPKTGALPERDTSPAGLELIAGERLRSRANLCIDCLSRRERSRNAYVQITCSGTQLRAKTRTDSWDVAVPTTLGARPPRSLLLPVIGAIVLLAWTALWWLEQSPYGWLFHRHGVTAHPHHGHVGGWLYASAFLLGWLLMTVAMMLPTTLPLVRLFRRMVADDRQAPFFIALVVTGYLAAWLIVGVIPMGMVWTMDWTLADIALPGAWIWGAGLFLLAGAFQFSSLKYACLDKCRTPLGFLISHWHGRNRISESFQVGWWHGLFCVGCCWALMLLMFAVGTASLAWMLLLALIMAVEKNVSWGRRVSRPLGWTCLGVGIGISAYHLAV